MSDEIITWSTFAFAHDVNTSFRRWGVYTAATAAPQMQTSGDLEKWEEGTIWGERSKKMYMHLLQY